MTRYLSEEWRAAAECHGAPSSGEISPSSSQRRPDDAARPIFTLARAVRLLPILATATMFSCALEPEGELVHIAGRGPSRMDVVSLRAVQPDGTTSSIHSWDIGTEARGHFDLTTQVDPANCTLLIIQGHWCLCGILGDGVFHATQVQELGRCGEHLGLVLVE